MKRLVGSFLIFLCVIISGVGVWLYMSQGPDVLEEYQRRAPVSMREMTYQSVSRTLDDGIVFYRPKFPSVPIIMKTERMSVRLLPTEKVIRLTGVEVQVADTLLARDGDRLVDTMKRFVLPDDLFKKPLEMLALLSQDTFKGDVEFRLREQGDKKALTVRFEQKGQPIMIIDTVLTGVPDNRLWGWVEGQLNTVTVQVMKQTFLRALVGYYIATMTEVPAVLKQAVASGQSLTVTVRTNVPFNVDNLFQNREN